MNYNYPIHPDDMQSVIVQQDGIIAQPLFVVSMIVIGVVSIFIIIASIAADSISGCFILISCVISGILLSIIIVSTADSNTTEKNKSHIAQATRNSWENQEEYNEFQQSIKRYLESQNISLYQNCDVGFGDFSDTHPSSTIICNNNKENLSGEVIFQDENNTLRTFVYDTLISENNEYLEFTMKEGI